MVVCDLVRVVLQIHIVQYFVDYIISTQKKKVQSGELPAGCLYSNQDRMVLFNQDQTDVKHLSYAVVCKTKAPFGATPEPGNDACEADGSSILVNLANSSTGFGLRPACLVG
eukprot:g7190.t1